MSIEPIFGMSDLVAQWVAKQPPFSPEMSFGPSSAIGWAENGVLIAGTVFHNYDPKAGIIEMSSAAQSPRWLTRPVFKAMFGYVFDQLHCQMVLMRVSERNERMRSIACRFGFTGVLIRRLYGRQENGIVFTLTEEEWRSHSMRTKNGQTISAPNPRSGQDNTGPDRIQ